MRLAKGVVMGVVVVGFMILLPILSFAKAEHGQGKIRILKESAAALRVSKPELASRLTQYADEEAKEVQEKKEGKKEVEGTKEEAMKEGREEHVKLLREAAVALKVSHPKLSEDLTKMANHQAKRMKKEVKKDKKEAGEAKENKK